MEGLSQNGAHVPGAWITAGVDIDTNQTNCIMKFS
ncbi:hypothetical protein ABAC402_01470 [Asticcacaulis sp. AC402]|nr:hypothetical protein ABAC402_01470 [Asticcacaulis sp. AC402]